MKKIKEITLFTNGDSNDLSVFSNVPYFFAQTLISKGIKVNRVDIGISKKMENPIFLKSKPSNVRIQI
ncbi:hypothetical protein AwDysgo_04640 [Bacteroidales bacterium]|nr:hypothetical protein AwDysgo_04640 [Bacteroidales bacterium]